MKGFYLLKSSSLVKSAGFIFVALVFFYFGNQWSEDNYHRVIFFNSYSNASSKTPWISISPNYNKTFDIISLINNTNESEIHDDHSLAPISQSPLISQSPPLPPPPPPPPPSAVQRLGLVDENGVMSINDFEVGEFDPDAIENWNNELEVGNDGVKATARVRKFRVIEGPLKFWVIEGPLKFWGD